MMVAGVSLNFLGAVDLFGDDEAGKLVRKDLAAEAPDEIGAVKSL